MEKHSELNALLHAVQRGSVSRRNFLKRATALGLTVPVAALLARQGLVASAAPAPGGSRPTAAGQQSDIELTVALVEEPPALEPHNLTAAAAGEVSHSVMPGLVYWDFDLGISPMVAEKWETSADGLTWTFTLRPNLVFHNGKACTAQEVVRNIEHIQSADSGSMLTPDFAVVTKVEAPDEKTVVFTLSEPFAPFLAVLSHRVAITDMDAYDATKPVGLGPYKIMEWNRGTGLVLERHDQYFEEGLPIAKKINWNWMPKSETRLLAIQSGSVDITSEIPAEMVDQAKADKELIVDPIAGVTHQYLAFNCAEGPFADVKLRKAVAHAVDKEAVLQAALWGYGTKTNIPFPPTSPWYIEIPDYERDLDKAKALLAEAGVADGFEVDMPIPNWSPAAEVAEIVQADLSEIGIKVNLSETEWATYWPETYLKSKFHITFMGYSARVDPDQTFYPRYHSQGVHNATRYSNPKMDELLVKGRTTIDQTERKAIYDEVQKLLVDELPWLWLYLPDVRNGWRPNIEGFKQHPALHIYVDKATRV